MLPGPAGPPRALWAPGAGLGLVDLAGSAPGALILSLGSLLGAGSAPSSGPTWAVGRISQACVLGDCYPF